MPTSPAKLGLRMTVRRVVTAVRGYFSAYTAEEQDAKRFRARQLQAILRLTPLAMAANVANVIVVDLALWDSGHRLVLSVWSCAVVVFALMGMRGWWQSRGRAERSTASLSALRHAAVQAGVLGATWGLLPATLRRKNPGGWRVIWCSYS